MSQISEYINHGWSLVPIPPNTKGPCSLGWNKKENRLLALDSLPPDYGVGLAHAYSGTMAFDIDNWELTTVLLLERGINLNELYNADDAVVILSGKEGRGKLLYSMPFGAVLPSKSVRENSKTIFELRCGTASGLTVQDILPPTIHPTTKLPYKWSGNGNWKCLPQLPSSLLKLWRDLLNKEVNHIPSSGHIDSSWQEIQSAIEVIPADVSRDEWIQIGMALHWAGTQINQTDIAFSIWDKWSSSSETKYPGERGILTQWGSFRSEKNSIIKLGTLFQIAKNYGWSKARADVSFLFTATDQDDPLDVYQGLKPAPPELDLSLWPPILANRAIEVGNAKGCDPLVPLWAGMSAICGVVDARIRLELMEGFLVPPILWLMTIGEPADKKSPGARPMMEVLKQIEKEDHPRYAKDILAWQGKEAMHAASMKAFLDYHGKAEALIDSDNSPVVVELPPKPVNLRITVNDITSQKLVRVVSDLPRGVLCYLDEMNHWVKKLIDRSSGEDRSAWVVSYESDSYHMDRVGSGSIYCENLAVSIYGNIQPAVFRLSYESLSYDGLLQRFIPAVLRASKTKMGNPVPDFLTTKGDWENIVRVVYSIPESTYKLSREAFIEFRKFQEWYEQAKQDERLIMSSDIFMTAFGKLEGTAGRLILLFHLIENPFEPIVKPEIVIRVSQIIKKFIIPSFRYALGEIAQVPSFELWLTNYILHNADKDQVTLRDIKNSARRQLSGMSIYQQDQVVHQCMWGLEEMNWVRRSDDGSREHAHRAVWAINPRLISKFEEYRKRVIEAKQRQLDYLYRDNEGARKTVKGFDAATMK